MFVSHTTTDGTLNYFCIAKMQDRIRAYIENRYTLEIGGFHHKPSIKQINIRDRKYTNDEILVITILLILNSWYEPERKNTCETYRSEYDVNHKSICKISKNYEFYFYEVEISINEDDLHDGKLIEVAHALKSILKAKQLNQSTDSYFIDRIDYNIESTEIRRQHIDLASKLNEVKRLLFYMFDID